MDSYNTENPAAYGEAFADVYDLWYSEVSDVNALVALVANLCGGSLEDTNVVECGVGTGRVAIKLAEAGARVTGIDASPAMLDRLQANHPSALITPVLGDMSCDIPVGPFDAAVVAFNTLFNLSGTAHQQRFFAHVASRLRPGGILVIEANEFRVSEAVELEESRSVRGGRVVVSTSRLDPESRTVSGEFTELSDTGEIVREWSIHYASTNEIDVMAATAGLELLYRGEDALGKDFTDQSERHVSAYRRPIL